MYYGKGTVLVEDSMYQQLGAQCPGPPSRLLDRVYDARLRATDMQVIVKPMCHDDTTFPKI